MHALAKDAPIILADEPTGNLDVKASKEVAALLKEVSKDKLVIVVTHNPEFFKQYATRRVRIYDGSVSEDKTIAKPQPISTDVSVKQVLQNRFHNIKNTLHIGVLNYKSRPKFTVMMSLALAVCAVTLFLVIALFGRALLNRSQQRWTEWEQRGKSSFQNRRRYFGRNSGRSRF